MGQRPFSMVDEGLYDIVLGYDNEKKPVKLNPIDTAILSKIHSFKQNDVECYMSNQGLADHFNISISRVKRAVKKLKDGGFVKTKSFDGRKRVFDSQLNTSWSIMNQQEVHYEPLIDNTINNTKEDRTLSFKTALNREHDRLNVIGKNKDNLIEYCEFLKKYDIRYSTELKKSFGLDKDMFDLHLDELIEDCDDAILVEHTPATYISNVLARKTGESYSKGAK